MGRMGIQADPAAQVNRQRVSRDAGRARAVLH